MTTAIDPAVSAAGTAEPGITVEDVSFDYVNQQTGERVHALDHIRLDVRPKEFLCILGPSGCGKSTLLTLIAGLQRPTAGRILVGGRPVTGPGADRGMVFQEYALLPWKTVAENIALGLKFRGIGRRERGEVARRFVELVNLTGFEDKYPHELSGGMRQRVAVARTLANSPAIMLMDEPFAAVDAQTRAALQEELTRIWEQSRVTVLFVTHHVDEAIFLGDRVLVLSPRPGRVHAMVPVDIPRSERTWATLERHPAFLDLKARLGDMIRGLGADDPDAGSPGPDTLRAEGAGAGR